MPDHQVLYRKYRPQSFAEVAGQDSVVRILSNALKLGRVAHAYLFSGPRGTGKTSVARIFARAVNCSDHGCNQCGMCREFLSGATLDLVEMDAASNRGVDDIRAIREAVDLVPARAKYKVYIVDEAHMLTKEAWNAFLKTLEEPPPHVIFVFATTEPEKIPETILSRVQHLRFRLVDDAVIVKVLERAADREGLKLDHDAASLLALLADGSLRDALNFLGQAQALSGGPIAARALEDYFGAPSSDAIAEVVSALAARDAKCAIECAGRAVETGSDPRIFLKLLIRHFRTQFLATLKSPNLEARPPSSGSGIFSAAELEMILRVLLETATTRFYSPIGGLPLELALHRAIREISI